jgi:hypothetical protein
MPAALSERCCSSSKRALGLFERIDAIFGGRDKLIGVSVIADERRGLRVSGGIARELRRDRDDAVVPAVGGASDSVEARDLLGVAGDQLACGAQRIPELAAMRLNALEIIGIEADDPAADGVFLAREPETRIGDSGERLVAAARVRARLVHGIDVEERSGAARGDDGDDH